MLSTEHRKTYKKLANAIYKKTLEELILNQGFFVAIVA